MEEKLDEMIINSGIAVHAVGSLFFRSVLKARMIILAAGLLYASMFCIGHSIGHKPDASIFTWAGVIAGFVGLYLTLRIIEGRSTSLPELEPVDHKVDGSLWANW